VRGRTGLVDVPTQHVSRDEDVRGEAVACRLLQRPPVVGLVHLDERVGRLLEMVAELV
jgi:hypothetical protein